MTDLREITDRLARDAAILADACDPDGAMDWGQSEIDRAVADVRQAIRDYRAHQAGQAEMPI
jgi:hypothetical protein